MRKIIALACMVSLAACASIKSSIVHVPYIGECEETENRGEIDALELVNMQNKTTFRVSEYVNCADEKSFVLVSWTGVFTMTEVDLAVQVLNSFFSHFHPGERMSYVKASGHSRGGNHTIVYEFTRLANTTI